jgi:ATP-binding cassette, subfamily F, member 3
VLDEPTNHLDIPAKQMLEDALIAYEGAALLVSHDRYFISRVANRIVELRDGELVLYRGDYAYYLEKKEEEAEAARAAAEAEPRPPKQPPTGPNKKKNRPLAKARSAHPWPEPPPGQRSNTNQRECRNRYATPRNTL